MEKGKLGNNFLKNLAEKKIVKLGILGGTFDPPHKGHLFISKIAIKKFKLNKLYWLITKKNPLKSKPHFDIKKRKKFSKKISVKEKKIFVKFLEDKVKSNNTYDLLKYIKNKNKKIKIYFIIGADNLVKFHRWKNWYKIPELAKIVVFPRKNYSIKSINSKVKKTLTKNDLIYVNSKSINISSSLIRKFGKT